MIKFKINIKYILSGVLSFTLVAKSYADDEKSKFIIRGELDPTTSQIITKKLQELKENDEKLRAEIYELQDKLISKNKDKIDLNIYVSIDGDTKSQKPNYGIVQLNGIMNNIPLIRYDHPLLFEKNEKFPLFTGAIPLGQYEFKIDAIVGQQLEKWPFVLPEGKWNIQKVIKIEAHTAGEKKDLEIVLTADKDTGIPQFETKNEEEKK